MLVYDLRRLTAPFEKLDSPGNSISPVTEVHWQHMPGTKAAAPTPLSSSWPTKTRPAGWIPGVATPVHIPLQVWPALLSVPCKPSTQHH